MPAFYLSSLLAFTGGHMVNYAVILYLQEKVGSDLLSGIGFGLSFGTSIVFGWFAGVLCDRISPTRVIHAAQALFILCLAGLWWTDAGASDATRVGWTLFSAFLGGLAWSFVGPARLATLGQIAPPDKLKPATIIFNLQVLLGFGLAPVVIGLVRSRHGWPAVFATGMGFFVAASLMLLGTRTRGSDRPSQGVFTELGEGFSAVKANPLLLQLILAAIMAYAMTGPMQILLPKLAREVLGLSELQRGGYLGLMALTLILGGVSALMLGKFLHHGAAIFVGTMTASLLFASLSLWTNAGVSATALGAMGLLGGMVISFIIAGIQGQAPEALRGRIMSIYSIISQVVPAASGVAAGALVRATGVTQAILYAGVGLAGLALLAAALMPQLRRVAR
ncbi:MAG TPA: MFS transporter [Burkholderiaceae bacterium]|nr:MFS transporter [Burkholderiaceae bacterium]HPL77815.1 MFS transporter [Burkholderiaceae bacterium]